MIGEILDDVKRLAGWQHKCDCGKTHTIGTGKVVLESGAIDRLPAVIEELELPRTAWVLADENTHRAAGERVVKILQDNGVTTESTVLKAEGDGYIGADDAYLAQARSEVWQDAKLFIGVGSGVINDLARILVSEFNARYVSVPTAASMNGYGSPISALIENGVKITRPAPITEAIIADLDVLAAAPVHLAQSGFGDLLAKNSSNADWYMSGQIVKVYYCPLPVEIVRRASEKTIQFAPGIKNRDPQAISALTEGLIAGAFAMDSAGDTAPASGAEHLISHYLEMYAHLKDYQPPLHGEQVALGTLIAAALYEKMRQVDIEKIKFEKLADAYPTWSERERQIRNDHGELAEIILDEARAQHLEKKEYRRRLQTIRSEWNKLWQALEGRMLGSEQVRGAYLSAGTPTKAKDLDIPPDLVVKAYRLGKDIRQR